MCEKVRRILNYKGLDYELVEVDRARAADHAAVSPFGKFPALLDHALPVCDSTDIAHHLEAAYPQRPLIPADPELAAQVHVLEDWADESLYFYEITMRISWENNLRRNIRGFMSTLPATMTEEEAFERVLKGSQVLVATQGLGRKTRAQVVADASRHVRALAAMLSASPFLVGGATHSRRHRSGLTVCVSAAVRRIRRGILEVPATRSVDGPVWINWHRRARLAELCQCVSPRSSAPSGQPLIATPLRAAIRRKQLAVDAGSGIARRSKPERTQPTEQKRPIMARLPYLTRADLPPEHQDLLARDIALLRLMTHSPGGTRAFSSLGGYIRSKSTLDARLRELAILQVGWLSRSPYEWSHHVKIGHDFGVSDEDIQALIDDTAGKPTMLDTSARIVLRAAREITVQGAASAQSFAALQGLLSSEHLTDLVLTIAFYCAVVRFLATMQVDVEPDFMIYLERWPLPED